MLSVGVEKRVFCGFKGIFASSFTSLYAVMTDIISYYIFPNNKLPLLESSQNAQPTSVAQDSNAKPKLLCRIATRSQTRPVCNKGSHSFCHPHTDQFVCSPVARQPPFDRYQVILLSDKGT